MKTLMQWLRGPANADQPPAVTDLDALQKQWWYYTVELAPGAIARGIYPDDLPMLPRLVLRNCDLAGQECLDLGSMEGLVPALMCRQGAKRVIAADGEAHCADKMAALQRQYGVRFGFRELRTVYDLAAQFPGDGFDVINLSGLLYHVFSPLMVLAGVRPLLKRNGLLIVSTNVIHDDSYTMEFNAAGRMQREWNTFWYVSVPLFDYLLRYLRLAPVDALYLPHDSIRSNVNYVFDKPSGYLAVACRAVDTALPTADDTWMADSSRVCWESVRLVDWDRAAKQPESTVGYRGNPERRFFRTDAPCLDLWEAVRRQPPVTRTMGPTDGHTLRLADRN
jgi:2-polyprenyl-3-methyl-5-hydroxy-6-metoxy-1,4-benzoquinol methylase